MKRRAGGKKGEAEDFWLNINKSRISSFFSSFFCLFFFFFFNFYSKPGLTQKGLSAARSPFWLVFFDVEKGRKNDENDDDDERRRPEAIDAVTTHAVTCLSRPPAPRDVLAHRPPGMEGRLCRRRPVSHLKRDRERALPEGTTQLAGCQRWEETGTLEGARKMKREVLASDREPIDR